jgi:glycosyltransferase involved in cell wall biosynthesis
MKETGVVRPVDVIPLAQQAVHPPAAALSGGKGLRAQALRIGGLNDAVLSATAAPYVLVVGTMESRKNLWRLTQAWARLAEARDLDLPRLVLAGKRSAQNEDFNTWMAQSGNLKGWVRFVDRPSDDALAYLYENCLFTATVSLYEGWGLPIGESLAFGKTAVVADNSSMPEVGGDMVEYCDATSIDSIQAACRRLIADPDHRRALEARIAATRLRSWDDVVADFLSKLEPGPQDAQP